MGFLVICLGITILQMSKVNPEKLSKLDRRSTMLLQAARSQAGHVDEKTGLSYEDPGIDTLRGSFGAVGSILRAQTLSQGNHDTTHVRLRPSGAAAPYDLFDPNLNARQLNLPRHQLYDPPVPRDDTSSSRESVISNKRVMNIKFDSQDVVHSYKRPGTGDNTAMHKQQDNQDSVGRRWYN
jgi:magnesium transporter